jgi:hypothetical protein
LGSGGFCVWWPLCMINKPKPQLIEFFSRQANNQAWTDRALIKLKTSQYNSKNEWTSELWSDKASGKWSTVMKSSNIIGQLAETIQVNKILQQGYFDLFIIFSTPFWHPYRFPILSASYTPVVSSPRLKELRDSPINYVRRGLSVQQKALKN